MQIKVTDDHIRRGERGTASSCPVALAIKEQIKIDAISVYGADVRLAISSREFYRHLPREVTEFVDDFDANSVVQPFEFTLPLPALSELEYIRMRTALERQAHVCWKALFFADCSIGHEWTDYAYELDRYVSLPIIKHEDPRLEELHDSYSQRAFTDFIDEGHLNA